MRTVPVNAERAYQVEIGVDWRVALSDYVEGRNKVVILCSESFLVKTEFPTIEVPDGELGKSPNILKMVWQRFGELGLNRGDLVVAIGGGAVTDLSGFAAATWLRGIDWLAIPTTLAGMVDAAIGGKTGINSEHGKNLVGAFHSPIAVLIDLNWLSSLSARDFAAGMAEVVKCGFIADPQILGLLENKSLKELRNDEALQLELIHKAVSVKSSVVSADFKESFLREILNYGHTLGHAIERHSEYKLRHGEAVAIGMCFVAELAKEKIALPESVVQLHYKILKALDLPVSYDSKAWPELLSFMQIDKKVQDGKIRFVAITEPGNCIRIENVSGSELQRIYERISQ